MKIINKSGLKYFEERYKAKLAYGNEKSWQLRFYIEKGNNLNKLINDMRGHKIQYGLHENVVSLSQEDLSKFLPKEHFTDKRVWFAADKMFLCSDMEHQHLSNTIGYLDLLLKLDKITPDKAKDYMKKIEESIVPELVERFNGEILPYKPKFDWEFKLIKELEVKENEKK